MRLPTIGIFPACTDLSMPILALAKAAEERGFSGIFLNEHTHIPVDHSSSRFPAGGDTPERYKRFWDPYTALSFVAAQTKLEVGTSVSLIGEHDPISLAKAIATIDVLSEGRFVFGVGWGWNREEFANHGFSPKQRAQLLEETVLLMKELWTKDVARFEGELLRLPPSWAWPKPHQKPYPPVYLGVPGNEKNYKRIARFADGWLPMGVALSQPNFESEIAIIHREFEAVGRDASQLRLRVIETSADPDSLRRVRERAATLGVESIYLYMKDEARDEALAILDLAAKAFD
jgi:probable F420-dependent oxidoreductase